MSKIAYSIHVKGKVQGVGFRASTKEKAEELGLAGWVRNEPDGSVYVHVEGISEKIRALIKWCHQGPPAADVADVDYSEALMEKCENFSIK